jgi:hypothetical protein
MHTHSFANTLRSDLVQALNSSQERIEIAQVPNVHMCICVCMHIFVRM